MCSGRVDEEFVEYAFERGAGGVLMSGCHIGDCHYIDANHYTKKRYDRLKAKKEREESFDADRLQLEWVSAAEGQKFAKAVTRIDDVVKAYVESKPEARADGGGRGDSGGAGGPDAAGDPGGESE